MSILRTIRAQLGLSNTETQNFTLTAEAQDGSMKLARGNAGATTQDILTVDAAGKVRAEQGINLNGQLIETGSNGIGYGTGAGGTVTQATSKSTAVTLNRPTGQITMNNATLNAGARVTFVCNNSLVTVNDVVVILLSGGSLNPDDYLIRTRAFSGGFTTSVINQGASNLSDAIVLSFAIIKGASS